MNRNVIEIRIKKREQIYRLFSVEECASVLCKSLFLTAIVKYKKNN